MEPVLVSLCNQWSSIAHMRVDPSCLLWRHSTFGHSFWIVPPYPFPIFPLYILYQCDGCPSSLLRGGSWLGCQDLPAMGAVSSRSWLPIVEAPGCLGHPTCIYLAMLLLILLTCIYIYIYIYIFTVSILPFT